MRNYRKIKQAGTALFLAAAVTAFPALPSADVITALAASGPVTEYDEQTLEKLRDNVLEYWEIPGLIEQYNTDFQNQLQQFYNNPDGSMNLTKTQLLDLAGELREEADGLSDEAEDLKDEITKESYQEYKENIRALRLYAKQLEEASEGKTLAGKSAIWGLKETRDKQDREARGMMREYQTLVSQDAIQKKSLEIAEQGYQSAQTKAGLSMATAEDVLTAEETLNSARAEAAKAASSLKKKKQELCTMLGWSYDANPEIREVPPADTKKVESFHPGANLQTVIDNNYTMREKYRTKSSGYGGRDKRDRALKDYEETIKTLLDNLYKDISQKTLTYEAACTKSEAARSDKAGADLKNAQGMLSRQEYLQEELTFLITEAEKEAANLDLVGAIEEYEWALKGLLDIEGGKQ